MFFAISIDFAHPQGDFLPRLLSPLFHHISLERAHGNQVNYGLGQVVKPPGQLGPEIMDCHDGITAIQHIPELKTRLQLIMAPGKKSPGNKVHAAVR